MEDNLWFGVREFVISNIRQLISSIAVFLTIISGAVVVLDIFQLSSVEKIIAVMILAIVFLAIVGGLAIYYLFSQISNQGISPSKVDLICIAFEVLNGDDGRARDDDHVYSMINRVYDLRGDRASLETDFVGTVAAGQTSRGIQIKYIGDYGLDIDKNDINIERRKPSNNNDTEKLTPKLKKISRFTTIIEVPFGRELSEGDEFDITLNCEDLGETPSNQDTVQVHFPMHRFKRIDNFNSKIHVPGNISKCSAAKVPIHRDLSLDRQMAGSEVNEKIELIDIEETFHGDYKTYHTHQTRDANVLYVYQFDR
jgi:hypothetical protein